MHCFEAFSCSFFLCRLFLDVETDVKTSEAAVLCSCLVFDQLSFCVPLLETLDIVLFQNNVMRWIFALSEMVLIRFKTDIGSKAQLLQNYLYQVKKLLHVCFFLGFAVLKFVVRLCSRFLVSQTIIMMIVLV